MYRNKLFRMVVENISSVEEIPLAVVGAHLSGMSLNHELKALNARLDRAVATAPLYRLYALNTQPPKPGLLRVAARHGASISTEVWLVPVYGFGEFVARIPAPLSIGTVQLADGSAVKGFLVEAEAIRGAQDITTFGGWREFIARSP